MGFIKLNVDATQFGDIGETGLGLVLRDDMRAFITCQSCRFSGNYRSDEALGLYEGLLWWREMNIQHVGVELDSSMVVYVVCHNALDTTTFSSLIMECRELLDGFSMCSIVHVLCTVNEMEHAVSRNSQFNPNSYTWVEPPAFVDDLLESICTSCSANNMS